MERDPEHPIWDVHDLRRTARLSVKCFCARLRALERQNIWLEITIATSTSSSALAGFAFWRTSSGETAWQVLAVISAVLAVAKPFLKIPDKVKHLESLATGYRGVEHDLGKIEILARQRGAYDQELKDRFAAILERMNALVAGPQDYGVSNRLRRVCQDEVDRELPHDRFYIPKET